MKPNPPARTAVKRQFKPCTKLAAKLAAGSHNREQISIRDRCAERWPSGCCDCSCSRKGAGQIAVGAGSLVVVVRTLRVVLDGKRGECNLGALRANDAFAQRKFVGHFGCEHCKHSQRFDRVIDRYDKHWGGVALDGGLVHGCRIDGFLWCNADGKDESDNHDSRCLAPRSPCFRRYRGSVAERYAADGTVDPQTSLRTNRRHEMTCQLLIQVSLCGWVQRRYLSTR